MEADAYPVAKTVTKRAAKCFIVLVNSEERVVRVVEVWFRVVLNILSKLTDYSSGNPAIYDVSSQVSQHLSEHHSSPTLLPRRRNSNSEFLPP